MLRDPIKTYDARWRSDDFAEKQIRRLFEATVLYASELGVDTVALSRDNREASPGVMSLAEEVVSRAGLRLVVARRPISTPQSYFLAWRVGERHPGTLGLTVTASHNPREYVGVKFTVPTVRAIGLDSGPKGGLTRVREFYHSAARVDSRRHGEVIEWDVEEAYLDFALATAALPDGGLDGLGVAIDGFSGVAGPEFCRLLERAGARVRPRQVTPDGAFPDGPPNPTGIGRMDACRELVQESGSTVGIGLDGDGDRLVFCTAEQVLTAGFAFVAVLERLGTQGLLTPGATVLYDPKVSPLALLAWARRGVVPSLFRNGHSQIKERMQALGAMAAAEESGHYYHRLGHGKETISVENSALTVLCFLAALRQRPGLLAELTEAQATSFSTGEFNYRFENDLVRDEALASVVSRLAALGAHCQSETADGIALEGTCLSRGVRLTDTGLGLEPSWYSGYLRVATNEPSVVRSYFSAESSSVGQGIEGTVREILEQAYGGVVVD